MDIVVENLTYTYNQGTNWEVKGIDHVSLKIFSGELVGIVGATGCGKSTLIQHFNGLLKPDSGKVYLNGQDVDRCAAQLRQRVGLVFQLPQRYFVAKTVFEEIGFGLKNIGSEPEQIEVRIKELISSLGLNPGVLTRSPYELSDGEKRYVAIASVLIFSPSVLILDEPTIGLDGRGQEMVWQLIKKLHQNGLTIIVSTHNLDKICKLAGRLIALNKGRVVFDGTGEQLVANSNLLAEIGL